MNATINQKRQTKQVTVYKINVKNKTQDDP